METVVDLEHLEFFVMERFFHEDHLTTRQVEGEERVKFLKPPSWYGGGKVPKDALLTKENKKLLQFDMIPAVDFFYLALEKSTKPLAKTRYKSSKPAKDKAAYVRNIGFRLLPKIVHACERRGIPQNFAPGIILLYLEHCEGCAWRHLVPSTLLQKRRALDEFKAKQNKGLKNAKLNPDDWPEYMVKRVEDFVKESKFLRAHAQK